MWRCLLWTVLLILARPAFSAEARSGEALIHWEPWRDAVFEQARREHRFVLLDLEAVWCHWCHVMDRETYGNPMVARLIAAKYIPVRVDQDANPDLSNRFGDWGWPATIVLAPNGAEIVKRQGYMPPVIMLSLLQAIIDDPSPGPSVLPQARVTPATDAQLSTAQRKRLQDIYFELYDKVNGGWGTLQKFIDDQAMNYALSQARLGKGEYTHMARQTLSAALNLIDPEWGGVYQYSDQVDWRSPHFEKIMSMQASYMRHYAAAYALWGNPEYIQAARAIHRYLTTFLLSPEGAFYTSQNADLNSEVDGHTYYALTGEARRELGIPRIDKNIYARENGWAIDALTALYDVTGDEQVLAQAETAARYILKQRALPGGGFSHGEADSSGPYLGDTLAMAEAFLSLHRSTGEREWLREAERGLQFIRARFMADDGGFITAPAQRDAIGAFREPVKLVEENVAVARLANLAYRYTGKTEYRELAKHAAQYLTSPVLLESQPFLPGVLLTDYELSHEPVHITVVGRKDDAESRALFAAALHYPADYLRVDWWDKREGRLPNPDVTYPQLGPAAAFACANGACSLPVFEPQRLATAVNRLRLP